MKAPLIHPASVVVSMVRGPSSVASARWGVCSKCWRR